VRRVLGVNVLLPPEWSDSESLSGTSSVHGKRIKESEGGGGGGRHQGEEEEEEEEEDIRARRRRRTSGRGGVGGGGGHQGVGWWTPGTSERFEEILHDGLLWGESRRRHREVFNFRLTSVLCRSRKTKSRAHQAWLMRDKGELGGGGGSNSCWTSSFKRSEQTRGKEKKHNVRNSSNNDDVVHMRRSLLLSEDITFTHDKETQWRKTFYFYIIIITTI